MIRPGLGAGPDGPGPIGIAPAIDGRRAGGAGHSYRTFVRRSAAADVAGRPAQASIGGAAARRFRACGDECVIGESGRSAGDRIVRDRQADLVRGGRASTKQLDKGGAGHQAEDESQSQETEFARGHAVTIS